VNWPTGKKEIDSLSDEKIIKLWRSLPSPITNEQRNLMSWIKIRYLEIKETPEFESLSKKILWNTEQ